MSERSRWLLPVLLSMLFVYQAVLASALCEATYGWLARLEVVVAGADAASLAALAQTELVRMITAWRALLAEHEPDQDGRCRRCAGWRRGRACPCSVWVAAHRYLVMSEVVPEPIAARIWARRELGESCVDVSLWLRRIGYRVRPDHVAVIAARYVQQRDAQAPIGDGGPA